MTQPTPNPKSKARPGRRALVAAAFVLGALAVATTGIGFYFFFPPGLTSGAVGFLPERVAFGAWVLPPARGDASARTGFSPETTRALGDAVVAWTRLRALDRDEEGDERASEGTDGDAKAEADARRLAELLARWAPRVAATEGWFARAAGDSDRDGWIAVIRPNAWLWAAWRWNALFSARQHSEAGKLVEFKTGDSDDAHAIYGAARHGWIVFAGGGGARTAMERALWHAELNDQFRHYEKKFPREYRFRHPAWRTDAVADLPSPDAARFGLTLAPRLAAWRRWDAVRSLTLAADGAGRIEFALRPEAPLDAAVFGTAAPARVESATAPGAGSGAQPATPAPPGPPALAQFDFAAPFARDGLAALGFDLLGALDKLEGLDWVRPNMSRAVRARLGLAPQAPKPDPAVAKPNAGVAADAPDAASLDDEEMPGDSVPSGPLPEETPPALPASPSIPSIPSIPSTSSAAAPPPPDSRTRVGFALLPKRDDVAPAAAVWSDQPGSDSCVAPRPFPIEMTDPARLAREAPGALDLFGAPFYDLPTDSPRNLAKRALARGILPAPGAARPALAVAVLNFDDLAESARAFPAVALKKKKRAEWRRLCLWLDLLDGLAGSAAIRLDGPAAAEPAKPQVLTGELRFLRRHKNVK